MLHGDANPRRVIQGREHIDTLAVLENPESPEFKAAVREERERMEAATKPRAHKISEWSHWIHAMYKGALPNVPRYAHETFEWHKKPVHIQYRPGHKMDVWYKKMHLHDLSDFGVDPHKELYFTIEDVGNGAESLELKVYTLGERAPLFIEPNVGPVAFFHNTHIIYMKAENQLRYPTIMQASPSGEHKRKLYYEEDKRFQVELFKPARQMHLFLRRANALAQQLFMLDGTEFAPLTPTPHADGNGSTLLPLAKTIYASNSALHIDGKTYDFPRNEYLVDLIFQTVSSLLIITTNAARHGLYKFDLNSLSYTRIYNYVPCHFQFLKNDDVPAVLYSRIDHPNAVYEIQDKSFILRKNFPEVLEIERRWDGVAGEHRIPYFIVSAVTRPRKLIVEAYGAYGISMHYEYPVRWLEHLRRGYAYAVVGPRGGRDSGDVWYDAARTAPRKHNTFEDTAVAIQAIQRRIGIKPAHTCFYGRSAGGWLAAAIAQTYSHTVGAVIAEVPYLDVLRTTSNPKLPLTIMEYDEFGNPLERRKDYDALLKISPVDIVHSVKQPPFVLIKTALHDSQVLPYESLKWAKKLRDVGFNVLTAIDGHGGHFAAANRLPHMLAEDAVLVDTVLTRSHTVESSATRKIRKDSKVTTRRLRSSLKQQTKTSTS